jgi:hypothetical protein
MTPRHAAALVFALFAAPLTQAHATTIRVPAQAPTIQQGIDAAATGDTVLVAAGTYTGAQNRNLDFHGKSLVVRSQAGYSVTTIDCQLLGRGFYLHTGETSAARIEGFTIHRGLAPEPSYKGGGILCEEASPTITDCRIQECEAFNGGGLSLTGPPTELRRCIVTNNRSELNGGGMSCERATLIECTISQNVSGFLNAGYGGGIDNGLGLVMTDCIVAGNRSLSYGDDFASFADGGGVNVGSAAAEARITRCTFEGNSALGINDNSFNTVQGGGACLLAGTTMVTECIFRENRVHCESQFNEPYGNLADGGGLACGRAVIQNCLFDQNTVTAIGGPEPNLANGGALFCGDATIIGCQFTRGAATVGGPTKGKLGQDSGQGGGVSAGGHSQFLSCTFAMNSASTTGASLYIRTTGQARFDKGIIAFSSDVQAVSCGTGASVLLTCSDLFGNFGGDWTGCAAGQGSGNGNLTADPLFCNRVLGNFQLDADSPCAPDHSPGKCDLIGALGVGCGVVGLPVAESAPAVPHLSIAPNPIRGAGRVEWQTGTAPGRLLLYDPAGRVVIARELTTSPAGATHMAWETLVGSHPLPSGVYYLRLDPMPRALSAVPVIVLR